MKRAVWAFCLDIPNSVLIMGIRQRAVILFFLLLMVMMETTKLR